MDCYFKVFRYLASTSGIFPKLGVKIHDGLVILLTQGKQEAGTVLNKATCFAMLPRTKGTYADLFARVWYSAQQAHRALSV